jgi:hypothetical protein
MLSRRLTTQGEVDDDASNSLHHDRVDDLDRCHAGGNGRRRDTVLRANPVSPLTEWIIIKRLIPLKPNEAWNLGPELYLPVPTGETPAVDERDDGAAEPALTAREPMIAGDVLTQTGAVSVVTQTGTFSGPVATDLANVDEGLANFGHIASAKPAPRERISLANLAPGLLPFFNNAPVFGLPGTVEGDFLISFGCCFLGFHFLSPLRLVTNYQTSPSGYAPD